jgi:hypothetical protein
MHEEFAVAVATGDRAVEPAAAPQPSAAQASRRRCSRPPGTATHRARRRPCRPGPAAVRTAAWPASATGRRLSASGASAGSTSVSEMNDRSPVTRSKSAEGSPPAPRIDSRAFSFSMATARADRFRSFSCSCSCHGRRRRPPPGAAPCCSRQSVKPPVDWPTSRQVQPATSSPVTAARLPASARRARRSGPRRHRAARPAPATRAARRRSSRPASRRRAVEPRHAGRDQALRLRAMSRTAAFDASWSARQAALAPTVIR